MWLNEGSPSPAAAPGGDPGFPKAYDADGIRYGASRDSNADGIRYGASPMPSSGYGASPQTLSFDSELRDRGGYGASPSPEGYRHPIAGHRRVPSGNSSEVQPRAPSFTHGGHQRIPSGSSFTSATGMADRVPSYSGGLAGIGSGPSPQNSPPPGHLQVRGDLPPLPRPEGLRSPNPSHLEARDLPPLSQTRSPPSSHLEARDVPPVSHFSHSRVPSGGSRHSRGGGGHFSHKRELSGSSNASGILQSNVTPCHTSSRKLASFYDDIRELGKGSFGVVWMVKERKSGQERVCKTVSTAKLQPGVLDMVRKEVELLCRLDHPYLVKMFEYSEDASRQELVLILEYVPGGSCAEALKSTVSSGLIKGIGFSTTEEIVARLIHQVLSAVAYCHASGVAHRDVKPEHMMLTKQHGLWGQPNCKLIDFGLAAFTAGASAQDFVGTPEYMAPEVLLRNAEDPTKTDIWSIGISAIEMLTKISPFGKPVELGSNEIVYNRIQKYHNFVDIERQIEHADSWTSRSAQARDFAAWVLKKDPGLRPSAQESLEHPWMVLHKDKRATLTRDMISSMQGYMDAHILVRCCLFVMAARTEVANRERLEAAFAWLDSDCDGEISEQDLAGALSKGTEWWDAPDFMSMLRGSQTSFDPADLMNAADLDYSGGLSLTEFIATCLYVKQDTTDDLVGRAFEALDDDRDGQVHASALIDMFQEMDLSAHGLLPQDKPVNIMEWRALFNEGFTQPTYQRKVVVRKTKRGWC